MSMWRARRTATSGSGGGRVIEQPSIWEHAESMCRQLGHAIVNALPVILLVWGGYTAQSINRHYRHWHWVTYLVGCVNAVILGVILYCLIEALGINTMIGYAIAVLAGRDTKGFLDLLSEKLVMWVRKKIESKKENERDDNGI